MPGLDGRFTLGRADRVREGGDVAARRDGQHRRRGGRGGRPARGARRVGAACSWSRASSPPPVDDLVAALARVPRRADGRGALRQRRARVAGLPRWWPSADSAAGSSAAACATHPGRTLGQPALAARNATASARAALVERGAGGARRRPDDARARDLRSCCRSTTRPTTSGASSRSTSAALDAGPRSPTSSSSCPTAAATTRTPSAATLAAAHPSVRVVAERARRLGTRGDDSDSPRPAATLLCYTNSARTAPEELTLMLLYAVAYPRRRGEGEPQDPRALATAPGLAALQSRVPGALRPVLLGHQRDAEGLSPQLRPAARRSRATTT